MMKAQTRLIGAMIRQSLVSVESAYEQAMIANVEGTSTVAPKATYLRRSQAGQASRLSAEAPESQKNTRSRRARSDIGSGYGRWDRRFASAGGFNQRSDCRSGDYFMLLPDQPPPRARRSCT